MIEALSSEGLDLTLWVVPEGSHGLMLGPGNALGYPPGLHDRLVEWVLRAAGAEGVPEPPRGGSSTSLSSTGQDDGSDPGDLLEMAVEGED